MHVGKCRHDKDVLQSPMCAMCKYGMFRQGGGAGWSGGITVNEARGDYPGANRTIKHLSASIIRPVAMFAYLPGVIQGFKPYEARTD